MRELQILAGDGFFDADAPARSRPRLSTTTWRWPSTPISMSLYCLSMPNLPMTRPARIWRTRAVELRLADFSGVADHVRAKSVLRIEAPLRVDQLHLRKEFGIAVRFDKREVGRRQFLLDDDRLVLGPAPVALELRRADRRSRG